MNPDNNSPLAHHYDAVIVGAGFAGLYMLQRLRGMGLSARVFEAGRSVGGTWYWNRYPGARCDVESIEYSFGFDDALEQEWIWTERFAAQPEIQAYLEHVATRFNLHRDISFDTRFEAAHFDESVDRWQVSTSAGSCTARFCIMATGCLSSANMPAFDGLDEFRGQAYHTGRWPAQPVDFRGLKVGVIGTGSSGVQAIPVIARDAAELTVFQRTANWSIPARNAPLERAALDAVKRDYRAYRARQRSLGPACHHPPNKQSALSVSAEEREGIYEYWWQLGGLSFMGAFGDLIFNHEANATAADFVARKVRATVKDAGTAEKLIPTHPIGCKRVCSDSGYYETYNRDNVTLVDLRETPIERFTAAGLQTSRTTHALDCVVFATGFDAMTGSLDRIDIRGRDGRTLRDKWRAGPRCYLGLGSAGFPNLFTITGPGSPSVLASMTVGIEHHVEWIAECIGWLNQSGRHRVEPAVEAEEAWVAHVNAIADRTLLPGCNSWYVGANIPGKPRVFMPYIGGFPRYEARCREVAERGYEGFVSA